MANPLDSEPELLPFVDPETRKLFRDRALSAHDEQWLLAEFRTQLAAWRASLPKPTREQMLQVTHEENRMHARLHGGDQQFWDGLEADWRRKQRPDSPQWNIPQEPTPPQRDSIPDHRPEDPKSSTRPSLDGFWEGIDAINQAANETPDEPKPWQEKARNAADEFTIHVGKQVEDAFHGNAPGNTESPTHKKPTLEGLQQFVDERKAEQKKRRRRPVKPPTLPTPKHPPILRTILEFLRRWVAVGGVFLLTACWTMIQINEYGLALILLVIGMGAFAIQLYDWKGIVNHRPATLTLKVFCVVLIVGCLVFFAAVIVKKKSSQPWSVLLERKLSPEPSKTLHQYFDEEVNNGLHKTLTLNVKMNDQTIPVQMRMSLNFQDRAEWLAFYVPDISEDDTFQVCTELLDGHEGAIHLFVQAYQGKIEMGPIGGRMTEVKDLKFTGYIRLYHETSLNQSELDMLTAQAQKKGLSIESRSTYYLLSQMPK